MSCIFLYFGQNADEVKTKAICLCQLVQNANKKT